MIISKSQGEKLTDKSMKKTYGSAGCGGICGNCDCRKSNGELFYPAFDPEMTAYNLVLLKEPQT